MNGVRVSNQRPPVDTASLNSEVVPCICTNINTRTGDGPNRRINNTQVHIGSLV